jgi:hypothetical protein
VLSSSGCLGAARRDGKEGQVQGLGVLEGVQTAYIEIEERMGAAAATWVETAVAVEKA